MKTNEFLDSFYKRVVSENIRISLALMMPPGEYGSVPANQEELFRESITLAFINPVVSDLFTGHTFNVFTYREVMRITNIVKCHIDYYDAIKTHYMYRADDLMAVYKDNPLSLIEMKVLFSETYNAVCESNGIEPSQGHEFRIRAVPPVIVFNLRRYVAMFRGAATIPNDIIEHYQAYKQLLVCLLSVFESYHKLREQGYEPED